MNKLIKKPSTLCLALSAALAFPLLAAESTPAVIAAIAAEEVSASRFKGYYTRLPFDDHGFTGKYADIVVELPQRGQFIFSRGFGYQPWWLPRGGKSQSVTRLIPRKGDGPDERPDNHNIACNAAIVAQTDESVTVHWRYAPDITKQSFTDFRAAYNAAGTPAPFYADYADEYFTIHADGKVDRTVKNGCYRLDEWNDPRNQIEQTLQLAPEGIVVTFADKPWRYVFWRGTRYLPSLVTGYGRDGNWSNDHPAT